MKLLKMMIMILFVVSFLLPSVFTTKVEGQSAPAIEAPAGFDDQTNGMVNQATHDEDRDVFEDRETIEDGLGPVYNAQACAECHQNPVTGAISQISETRAGRLSGGVFVGHPGDTLINDRAIDASIQEMILPGNDVRTFRSSLNTLGDGFIEAIDDNTIIGIAAAQPFQSGGIIAGQVIKVPVMESGTTLRVARFGWKNQHASLLSFSADAYLNEMGITSPLFPTENTSNGRSVAAFDTVADPEEPPSAENPFGEDIEIFTRFMRASKVPPRDTARANSADARAGAALFNTIGCNICHVPTITTAPVNTLINGGNFRVPAALGNKIIHPYSDFLLHDLGTGDGIVQNGGATTRNKMRTPPLWGVRTRNRLMHDGLSLTFNDAILRHGGESILVTTVYRVLPESQKQQIVAFLNSL